MKNKYDLVEDNILKLFFKFLGTSTTGMIMVSLYILFDTIFVGQGVGKEGLAALNIALPAYNLLFGTGTLLGTGGATAMAVSLGSKDKDSAQRAFNHSLVLGIIMGIIYTVIGLLFMDKICYFLGAGPETLPLIKEYLGVVIPFSWSFLMVYNLSIIVRNDHGPKRAMIAMAAGGITNAVMDYVFVFPLGMGMRGAAIATVMSSLVSLSILLMHFIGGHSNLRITSLRLRFDFTKRIVSIGIASFIIEISSGLVIFLFNKQLLSMIGEIGVSAYSIIANVSLMCVAIFTGIAQGIQPIASINFGAKKYSRVYTIRKLGIISAAIFGMLFFILGLTIPETIVSAFTSEKGQIIDITKEGIKYYFLAFPIMGINIVMGSYFQSIEKTPYSTAISLCRGIIFTALGLKLLTLFLGISGIWLTVPMAEILTLIIITVILYKEKLQRSNNLKEEAVA